MPLYANPIYRQQNRYTEIASKNRFPVRMKLPLTELLVLIKGLK